MALFLPPQNMQAEEACIASALIEDESAKWLVENVQSEAFYSDHHRLARSGIAELIAAGSMVGPVELSDWFRKVGKWGEIGGMDYFKRITASVASADHIAHYGAIVLRLWHERRIQVGAMRLANAINTSDDDGRASAVEAIAIACRDRDSVGVAPTSISESLQMALSEIETKPPRNIKTGLCLDSILSTQPGHVLTIAARTSFGKTATALSIALNMAKSGERVVYFSTEMTTKQVIVRALSAESGVENWRIAKRIAVDWKSINAAAERISELPMSICPDPHPTIASIRSFSDSFQASVIVIDYLTRCGLPRAESMRLMVTAMMQGLKSLALQTDRLVIVCAQVGRAADRHDNRAGLADLKESSAIEEESDAVIILSMTDEQRAEKGIATMTANILKNRHGPLGEFSLSFDKPHQRVMDTSEDSVSNPLHPSLLDETKPFDGKAVSAHNDD